MPPAQKPSESTIGRPAMNCGTTWPSTWKNAALA